MDDAASLLDRGLSIRSHPIDGKNSDSDENDVGFIAPCEPWNEPCSASTPVPRLLAVILARLLDAVVDSYQACETDNPSLPQRARRGGRPRRSSTPRG